VVPTARGNQVVEIGVMLARGHRDHALVGGVDRQLVQFHPRENADLNSDLAAVFDDALQADVAALLGDSDPLEGTTARLERFGHRVDSINYVHWNQFTLREAMARRRYLPVLD